MEEQEDVEEHDDVEEQEGDIVDSIGGSNVGYSISMRELNTEFSTFEPELLMLYSSRSTPWALERDFRLQML